MQVELQRHHSQGGWVTMVSKEVSCPMDGLKWAEDQWPLNPLGIRLRVIYKGKTIFFGPEFFGFDTEVE